MDGNAFQPFVIVIGGTPISGGASTQILFEDANGKVTSDSTFIYNVSTKHLGIGGDPLVNLHIIGSVYSGKAAPAVGNDLLVLESTTGSVFVNIITNTATSGYIFSDNDRNVGAYLFRTGNTLALQIAAVDGLVVDSLLNVTIPAGILAISGAGPTEVPISATGASGQSVDLVNINFFGGSGGDAFLITNNGIVTTQGTKTSNVTEGNTGGITRTTSRELHTLAAAATSNTTLISIPLGARLISVHTNNNVAVSDDGGDDTWTLAFVTGSTTSILNDATGASIHAAAINTKVNFMVPDEKTTGVAELQFTANGGSFDGGVIEIVVVYEFLTSLADV